MPYTGCVGLEHMIDHPGPMATDVETVARTLSVIAGSNERDLRRPEPVPVEQYEEHLTGETSDLSIGVLEEGFGKPAGDPAVEDAVLDSLDLLEERGATVDDVSVPLHADARRCTRSVRTRGWSPRSRGKASATAGKPGTTSRGSNHSASSVRPRAMTSPQR